MRKLRILTVLLVAAAVVFGYYRFAGGPANVLLITIDTLRADHVGCYGYSRNITPNLDRFASRGVLFENAFCTMAATIPSHASILYGSWPRVHGSTSNFKRITNLKLPFLPAILKQQGYATAAFVSAIHLGKAFKGMKGLDVLDFPERFQSAEVTLARAQKWLDQNHDKKYFLWIHLWDPHSPYDLHPEFMKKINPDFDNNFEKHYAFFQPGAYTQQQAKMMKDLYDNEIAYTDAHLGTFLDRFEDSREAGRTMIVLVSDHGETLDELVEREDYGFDHGEFLYDHQVRVPLIVALPGRKQAGMRVAGTVCLIDILPTVLDQLGVGVPAGAAGNSLMPYVRQRQVSHPDEMIFLQRREYKFPPRPFLAQNQFGIREPAFKLLFNAGDRTSFLYRNTHEFDDVIAQQPSLKALLQKRLDDWLHLTASYSQHGRQAVSEEEAEELRSLGYVQ